jgi:hypothetical protein
MGDVPTFCLPSLSSRHSRTGHSPAKSNDLLLRKVLTPSSPSGAIVPPRALPPHPLTSRSINLFVTAAESVMDSDAESFRTAEGDVDESDTSSFVKVVKVQVSNSKQRMASRRDGAQAKENRPTMEVMASGLPAPRWIALWPHCDSFKLLDTEAPSYCFLCFWPSRCTSSRS